jgi:hypothetical protein
MTWNDKSFDFENNQGKATTSREILQHFQPLDFQIVGYGLSTEGWLDPFQFLQNPLEMTPNSANETIEH